MLTRVRMGILVAAAMLAAAAVLAHLRAPALVIWPLLLPSVVLVSWATGWAGGLGAAVAVSAVVALAESGLRPAGALKQPIEWGMTAAGYLVAAGAVSLGSGAARCWRGRHDRLVEALVAAMDGRFEWSRGRSARVAAYAAAIGRRLGVRGRRAENLRLAALLHDVGTILVSPEVLTKQGVLSGRQRAEIETHPDRGVNLLASVGYHQEVLDAVRYHHERSDGTGYPSGLVSTQMPLLARIVAVADAFEALTQDRPYRPAMPASDAVSLLGRGTYWPNVLEALSRALDEGEIVAPRPARRTLEPVGQPS